MATLYRRGKTWYANFTVDGRRVQHSLKTSRKALAEETLREIDARIVRQEFGVENQDHDAHTALTEFLNDRRARATEHWVRENERYLRSFLASTNVQQLKAVKPPLIERYIQKVRATEGLVRAKREFQVIRTFLRWCRRMGYLPTDPTDQVSRLPSPPRKPIRFLSVEEAEKVLQACRAPVVAGHGARRERKTPLYQMASIALYAGLRLGEILNLHWEDIHFEKGGDGGYLEVTVRKEFAPKDKEFRRVPLHPRLWETLHIYQKRKDTPTSGLVFVTREQTRYMVNNASREFHKIAERAGVAGGAGFYLLRHTFASWLAMQGVSLHIIARFLGHATTQVTEMHYAGLVPEALGEVIAKLPGIGAVKY